MSAEEKPISIQWNQVTLDAIKYTQTSPPLAARALAMVHTAMYDAWSVFNNRAISTTTASSIKIKEADHCTPENRRMAFSYAAYRVLMHIFWLPLPAEHKQLFTDLMCKLGYDPDDHSLDIAKPQGIGNLMAALTIGYRSGDGSNPHSTVHDPAWSDYSGYKPVNTADQLHDPGYWQPLKTAADQGGWRIQQFLVPHWGLVKAFALQYNWEFRPAAPYKRTEAGFKQQAEEILRLSEELTSEHKAVSEYWSDRPGTYTPPGHWFEIAQFIALKNDYDNSHCIRLFFALGNAMLDASIASWECKRHYNSARPVTVIRELFRGQDIQAWGGPYKGTRTIKGESWQSYIPTPPFPEHVSGHSTFGHAAAFILKEITGSDEFGGCITIEKGSSKTEPETAPHCDVVLDWPTFSAAAEQAGMSCLYGGIHFRNGNELGRQLGKSVAGRVWNKVCFYFNEK